MGVIAGFERGRIGERVRDGRRYRVSQGHWPSGRTLYGYGWLLQGLCVCGECGHVLACIQKNQTERRYYGYGGRYPDAHLDGSPKCTMPRLRADILEKAVWRRLKTVLTDSTRRVLCLRLVREPNG